MTLSYDAAVAKIVLSMIHYLFRSDKPKSFKTAPIKIAYKTSPIKIARYGVC